MAVDLKVAAHKLRDVVHAARLANKDALAETGDAGAPHIYEMLEKLATGHVFGEQGHRWLGYVQGVLVARGLATIDQMRNLNFTSKEPRR